MTERTNEESGDGGCALVIENGTIMMRFTLGDEAATRIDVLLTPDGARAFADALLEIADDAENGATE